MLITVFLDSWLSFEALCSQSFSYFATTVFRFFTRWKWVLPLGTHTHTYYLLLDIFHVIEHYYSIECSKQCDNGAAWAQRHEWKYRETGKESKIVSFRCEMKILLSCITDKWFNWNFKWTNISDKLSLYNMHRHTHTHTQTRTAFMCAFASKCA